MLRNLSQPEQRLQSDYDRTIVKSTDAMSGAVTSRKNVPQLGEQEKQSCPLLKVYAPEVGQFPTTLEEYNIDPELLREYKEAADAQGMTIPQYLSQLEYWPTAEEAYKYKYGQPLVKPKEVDRKSVV